jgi:hypothetical protein
LDILGGTDSTEAAGNFEKLKSYVKPSFMKEEGAEDAMKGMDLTQHFSIPANECSFGEGIGRFEGRCNGYKGR